MVPTACNTDTSDRYVVDFSQVDTYLAALNQKRYFSAAYLDSRRTDYRRWSDSLQLHPQFDGPPRGFDYDPIYLSQDPDDLDMLLKTSPRILRHHPDSIRVGFDDIYSGPDGPVPQRIIFYDLSRHNKRWLIDAIKIIPIGQ